jgi:hypothetical protein
MKYVVGTGEQGTELYADIRVKNCWHSISKQKTTIKHKYV